MQTVILLMMNMVVLMIAAMDGHFHKSLIFSFTLLTDTRHYLNDAWMPIILLITKTYVCNVL